MAYESSPQNSLFFDFGGNWLNFIRRSQGPGEVSWDTRVQVAKYHLRDALRVDELGGMTFVDAGCGSGIFSLAALRLGAGQVVSFDLQAGSVEAANLLWQQEGEPKHWHVLQGSVLDLDFLANLPRADVVYAWGSLHHTGDVFLAMRNVATLLKPTGLLHMALYNKELTPETETDFWDARKKEYTELQSEGLHQSLDLMVNSYVFMQVRKQVNEVVEQAETKLGRKLTDYEEYRYILLSLNGQNSHHTLSRGMDLWTDARDALGGWPNQRVEAIEIIDFAKDVGLATSMIEAHHVGGGLTSYNLHHVAWLPPLRGLQAAGYRVQRFCGPFVRVPARHEGCWARQGASWAPGGFSSLLRLHEDGYHLGLSAGAHHNDGRFCSARGRYSHEEDGIFFMTSDFTDPNNNGRDYHISVPGDWAELSFCNDFA